jgi:ornithine--oxo-acid transaminase
MLVETSAAAAASYRNHVNPQWVRLLDVLQMNLRYTRCEGVELYTTEGRRILDFLSGYCVHNTGHNHPRIVAALKSELDACGPAMLQSHVPELAGELAERLCSLAGGRLRRAFFCSSGSEGVEAAIKFARAYTGRTGLIYAQGAFHGLTCGALSLMGDPFWSRGFGPMLPDTCQIPFGDLESLERTAATKKYAALFLEPVQGEAGIVLPESGYLRRAREICRKYGTLLVLDEVQTGLHRCGPFLASHDDNADPDMVILAKALSGGLVPSGAVLMTPEVCDAVYDSLKRAIVHTSTYSENGLAMRAGLATLDVVHDENLGDRADAMGRYLRDRLAEALRGYEMVKEIRGAGLLNGIEFQPPRSVKLRVAFEAFRRIHPGLFGQVVVMRMFQDRDILTQMCGNNLMVLKAAPPLVVNIAQVDEFVSAAAHVVEQMHSSATFWSEALGMARRVLNI